mgnify:CR=1 FL=1
MVKSTTSNFDKMVTKEESHSQQSISKSDEIWTFLNSKSFSKILLNQRNHLAAEDTSLIGMTNYLIENNLDSEKFYV